LMVIVNGILIGVATDHTIPGWEAIEMAFLITFMVELGLKVFAYQNKFWEDLWNVGDALIIASAVLEQCMELAEVTPGSGTAALRVVRVLRLVRIIGRFERLNTLIEAFMFSLYSTMWVGVLMILFLYIFGVMATNLFGHDMAMLAAMESMKATDPAIWWSTVPRSMSTLLQVITGDSWNSQVGRPMQEYSELSWLFLAFVLIMVGMGFLNLMSAIFVDSLLEMNQNGAAFVRKKKKAAEEKAMETVAQLFAKIDTDRSGTLDEEELAATLRNIHDPCWEPILSELGVTPENIEATLQNVPLEEGDNGEKLLFYEDFLSLFCSLEDPATKKSMFKVEKTLSKMQKQLDTMQIGVDERFATIEQQLNTLLGLLSKTVAV